MKQNYRRLLVALLLIGISCLPHHAALGQEMTKVTDPKFKLQGLDGRVYDLADLRGNVVLVSFGATWCAPCSTELRALEELRAEYQNQPVKFYWVSIERPEEVSDSALKHYARERKVSFPVLRDTAKMRSEEHTSELQSRLHIVCRLLLDKNIYATYATS